MRLSFGKPERRLSRSVRGLARACDAFQEAIRLCLTRFRVIYSSLVEQVSIGGTVMSANRLSGDVFCVVVHSLEVEQYVLWSFGIEYGAQRLFNGGE